MRASEGEGENIVGNLHVSSISSGTQQDAGFGILALMLYLFFLLQVLSDCAATRYPVSGKAGSDAMTHTTNCTSEERLGIRDEGLRLSATCNTLDLRYRVNDAEKAAPLQNHPLSQVLQSRSA